MILYCNCSYISVVIWYISNVAIKVQTHVYLTENETYITDPSEWLGTERVISIACSEACSFRIPMFLWISISLLGAFITAHPKYEMFGNKEQSVSGANCNDDERERLTENKLAVKWYNKEQLKILKSNKNVLYLLNEALNWKITFCILPRITRCTS